MFAETLLESSPLARKRKRWPMATAFTVETLIAAVVVIVPLLSTGVIPLSARVQPPAPLKPIHVDRVQRPSETRSSTPGATAAPARPTEIVLVSNNQNMITIGPAKETTTDPTKATPGDPGPSRNDMPANLIGPAAHVRRADKPVPVSVLSEAQLVNRVEPVYPRPAILAGIQGEVKLHAIISRDGRIMSLNVVSGNPLLAQAAREAVSQWRYRPYYLNGQAVEVETFITVNFKKEMR